jgi:hypothetical protein
LTAVAWGVPTAIVIAGLLRLPSLSLFARAIRRPLPPPVPVEVAAPEITGMPQPTSEP